MKRGIMFAAVLTATSGAAASAQDTYYWPAPVSASVQASRTYFPMGTGLALRTRTEANTKQMKPGDRVYLEVAESLSYRGQIVVPVGAPVVGEVVRSEQNGHFGKRGTIEMRLLYVETPYGPVRLSGGTGANGKAATAWSLPVAWFVTWPAIFVHGTSGYIRAGTPITGYLAEPLTFIAAPPAPPITAAAAAQPDDARALPARFDPAAFGGVRPGFANR